MTYNSAFTQTGVYHLPPGTDVMVGDLVTGEGVVAGTLVTSKVVIIAIGGPWNGYSSNSTYIQIKLSTPISTSDPAVNNYNYNFITSAVTGLDYGGWSSVMSFSRVEQVTSADPIVYLAGTTISFKEDVKGWVSFKSFTPENAISCANEYYTFKNGKPWKHHDESQPRNTFYNIHKESKFTVILNDIPGSVKSFQTLNYEGSQARVLENLDTNFIAREDGEYYNLTSEKGWFVESAETNLEKGGVNEFIEKEGKWFASFTGVNADISPLTGMVVGGFNSADFSMQGIGRLVEKSTVTVSGCTNPTMSNYNASANVDDGSCIAFSYGCMDPSAINYNSNANTPDGSCVILGCTDSTAFNYNSNANFNNGSCIAVITGCMDSQAINYNSNANTDSFGCIATINGCMDPTAWNYNFSANVNDNSCIATVYGCIDSTADNYNSNANTTNGTCTYTLLGCTDATANNYDSNANTDNGSCTYGVLGCTNPTALNYNASATIDNGTCVLLGCTDLLADNYDSTATSDDGSCSYTIPGCTDVTANNYDATATSDDGSCTYTNAGCTDVTANNYDATAVFNDGTCTYDVLGCDDATQFNYDPLATYDDGSCIPFTYGCMDLNASNYSSTVNTADGSCQWVGCTDANACNYDAIATIDDLTCETCGDITAVTTDSADATCTGGCLYCYSPTTLTFSNVTATAFTFAWTQPSNSNDGTTNNYSWHIYDAAGFTATGVTSSTNITATGLSAGTTYTVEITRDCSGTNMSALTGTQATLGPPSYPGCTDYNGSYTTLGATGNPTTVNPTWGACNFNPQATVDDGSCDYTSCAGCTDPLYLEYCGDCWNDTFEISCVTGSGNVNCGVYLADDDTCDTLIVNGCTDPTAFNYDASATVDDSSCIAVVLGCIDDTTDNAGNYATNYDALANTNDGSCNAYACPVLSISSHSAGHQVTCRVNNVGTIYPLNTPFNVAGQGQSGLIQTSQSGQFYSDNPVSFGSWGNYSPSLGLIKYLSNASTGYPITNFYSAGDSSFDATFSINLNNGLCPGLSVSKTLTVGCMDSTAANYDISADMKDDSQCEYSGCTDATLVPNANGVGYTTDHFATNYDPNADIPCTDVAGGATGSPGDENICCEYTEPSVYLNKVNHDTALELVYDTTDTGFSSAFLGMGLNINGSYNAVQYLNNTNLHNNTFAQDALVNLTTLTTQPLKLGVVNTHYAQFGSQVNNTYLNDSHSYTAYFSNTYTYGCRDAATVGNISAGANNPSDTTLSQVYPATSTYSNVDPTLDMHEIGSCIEDIYGCQDTSAINLSVLATADCLTGTCCYYNCTVPNNFTIPQAQTHAVAIQVSDQSPTNIGFRVTTELGSSIVHTDYFIDSALGGSNYTLPQPNSAGFFLFAHLGADGVGAANGGDDWVSGDKPLISIRSICLFLDVSAIPPVESTGYSSATAATSVSIP